MANTEDPMPRARVGTIAVHMSDPPRPDWTVFNGLRKGPIGRVEVMDGLAIQATDPQHLLDLSIAFASCANALAAVAPAQVSA